MSIYVDFRTPDKMLTDKVAIDNAIKNIIMTKRGSLPGKPDFGSHLSTLLFELIDHNTVAFMQTLLMDVLRKYEPRIKVINIQFNQQPEYNRLIVEIQYKYNYIRTEEYGQTKIIINR